MNETTIDIDELALWALEQAGGAVRTPMLRAIQDRYPDMPRVEADRIVGRAFRLSAERRTAGQPESDGVLRERTESGPTEEALPVVAHNPPKRRVGQKMSKAERKELHEGIRSLVAVNSEISHREAYNTLAPSVSFSTFEYHFRNVAGKRTGNLPRGVRNGGTKAVEPETAAPPAAEQAPEPEPPVGVAGIVEASPTLEGVGASDGTEKPEPPQAVALNSGIGSFTAELLPCGAYEVRMTGRVDVHRMLNLMVSAMETLYLTDAP